MCSDMLFAHAFSSCDTTSRIFGFGKKTVFEKLVNGNSILRGCAKIFSVPRADHATIETTGCKAMVSLFCGTQSDNLESLHYIFLCKKVATAITFVKAERLPTTLATNLHSRQTYRSYNGSERMKARILLNGVGTCKGTNLFHL